MAFPKSLALSLVFVGVLVSGNGSMAQAPTSDDKSQKEAELTEDEKLLQELKKNLERDRQLLEKYFQKDFLDKVDSFFRGQFGGDDFGVNPDDLRRMNEAFKNSFSGLGTGLNSEWQDHDRGKVLIIHGAVVEGGSFDLKVKEGNVTIKARLQRDLGQMGKRLMRFQQTFPVPEGTDANKVRIENSKQGLQIVFPWKKGQRPKSPSGKPLEKDEDDVTI